VVRIITAKLLKARALVTLSQFNAPLCQAVTTAVYIDMQNSELKAKNITFTGLDESDDCSELNLFSAEFDEQPNIALLGKRDQAVERKAQPLRTKDPLQARPKCTADYSE